MKIKKILSIFMVFALMLGISSYSTINKASTTSAELTYTNKKSKEIDYVSFGKKVIESYYRNRDLGVGINLSKDVTPEVAVFLDAKAEVKQHSTKVHKNYKTNYNLAVNLLESKTLENKIYLKFQVDISFNYTDLPDVDSGEGTIIEVVVDSKNNKIIDMYEPYDYFDNSIRGISLNILDDSNRLGVLHADKAKAKSKELITEINN